MMLNALDFIEHTKNILLHNVKMYLKITYSGNYFTHTVGLMLWAIRLRLSFGVVYNSSVYEQKAVGVSTGGPDHIGLWNDTGMGKVESFILLSPAQRRGGANKRERPLKCNLGPRVLFEQSGGVYRWATRFPGRDAVHGRVSVRARMCVCVCKREILIADAHLFFFLGHPLLIDLCVITFGMTGSVI